MNQILNHFVSSTPVACFIAFGASRSAKPASGVGIAMFSRSAARRLRGPSIAPFALVDAPSRTEFCTIRLHLQWLHVALRPAETDINRRRDINRR
jgi:hypothetical protein